MCYKAINFVSWENRHFVVLQKMLEIQMEWSNKFFCYIFVTRKKFPCLSQTGSEYMKNKNNIIEIPTIYNINHDKTFTCVKLISGNTLLQ